MTPEELLQQASSVDIDNIKQELRHRKQVRYVEPNKQWILDHLNIPESELPPKFSFMDDDASKSLIKKHLVAKKGPIKEQFSLESLYFEELNVGDVVDLSDVLHRNDLAVVVELPGDALDERYTLIDQFGEIQFVSRHNMGMRMPQVFPSSWFEGAIMNEADFADENVGPIGRPKYKIEDTSDRAKLFDSVMAKATFDNDEANNVERYIAPSILTGIISQHLAKLINNSWEMLPEMNVKLEVLHNTLQSNEAPIQLTLFQLYQSIRITNLDKLVKGLTSNNADYINRTYKSLFMHLRKVVGVDNQFDAISLGKKLIGELEFTEQVTFDRFYAFILSLRKNDQIYHFDAKAQLPTYVTVVPLNRIVQFNTIVNDYKADDENYELLSIYITKKIQNDTDSFSKPENYDNFIELLKLYCAGSITDAILESFIVKIIRMLPTYNDIDISRTTVYELLLKLQAISETEDPYKWWYDSNIPGSGISAKADLEDEYYHMMTPENLNHFLPVSNDPVPNRSKFDDIVYCIDGKDALELDDGVSITRIDEENFRLSTFVADPASYLDRNSQISRIAFQRGSTLYLPNINQTESVSLLPHAFVQKVQLGQTGVDVNVLKVSFKFNITTGKVDFDNAELEFGTAKNFVVMDYGSVNEVINDKSIDLSGVASSSNVTPSKLVQDLKDLYLVSSKLHEVAEKAGRTNIFDGFTNVRKEITDIVQDENNKIKLAFKEVDEEDPTSHSSTKSELLVSELMIMTNTIAANYLKKNNIPAIYKMQNKLPMSESAAETLEEIKNKGNDLTFQDICTAQVFSTRSKVTSFPAHHESLKLEGYATVTSPLRRFADLVNHWQLISHLHSSEPMFSPLEINNIAAFLIFKQSLNDRISKKMNAFYIFKVLKQLQLEANEERLKLKCIVYKKPSDDGLVHVTLLEYGIRCILKTNWYSVDAKDQKIIKRKELLSGMSVGDVIDDAYIEDVDLLEGSIVLRSSKKSKDDPVDTPASDNEADWDEGSKKPNKKQLEKLNKKQEELDKKKEREAMLLMEEQNLESGKKAKGGKGGAAGKKGKKAASDLDDALNSFSSSGKTGRIDAHGVEDSLAALTLLKSEAVSDKDIDRHPERRFKAALAAYTERRLPEVKAENPGLRKQQLEQLIYKEFQKADENPFNKDTNVSFNAGDEDIRKVKDAVKDKRSKKFER
ncbi:hypothetical protein CANARDRAFT_200824 [[Candida] arabinofermentans NRRL YB-2248]|uniref:RNB domain-containing protein n=1 Tax=[Candida] arabinofermentans NRRL YB-2248 TaxID=983967 RepID=A0A1E4SYQ5_9ASCO|nr:hypothetical protein CANARDRAFT_200824 [[Candida] arabinofermentans NRRL YB-2248]